MSCAMVECETVEEDTDRAGLSVDVGESAEGERGVDCCQVDSWISVLLLLLWTETVTLSVRTTLSSGRGSSEALAVEWSAGSLCG